MNRRLTRALVSLPAALALVVAAPVALAQGSPPPPGSTSAPANTSSPGSTPSPGSTITPEGDAPLASCIAPRAADAALACPSAPPPDPVTPVDVLLRTPLHAASSASPRRGRAHGRAVEHEFTPRAFTDAEGTALRMIAHHLCASASALQPGQSLALRYRRAYLYYAANQLETAAALFRDVLTRDASEPDPANVREYAADLYLDALNVLGSRAEPARPACYEQMARDIPRVRALLCATPAAASARGEFCGRMESLACNLARREAESLHAARRFREAGERYAQLAQPAGACGSGARTDELLYNAAIEFDAARMLAAAMRAREALVTAFLPRGSEWAQRALYRLAGNHHALQDHARAAEAYERYVAHVLDDRAQATRAEPEALAQAADALRQATIFRIGLGDEPRALANVAQFERAFGVDASRRRLTAAVVYSIGHIYIERARRLERETGGTAAARARRLAATRAAWGEALRHYQSYVNRYGRSAGLDQNITGLVALGRAHWHLGQRDSAMLHFRAASDLWGDGSSSGAQGSSRATSPGELRIREHLGDEAGDAVELARDAVAEARFYMAERLYEAFETRALPAYRGPATRQAYDAWARASLMPFVQEQHRRLTDEATPAYQRVIAMHVPNWEIAAAARLAGMFQRFGQFILAAAVPPDIARNADLREAYESFRRETAGRFFDIAISGFEGCGALAARVQWFNEWSEACARGLNAIDARRFPMGDEILPDAGHVASRPVSAGPAYERESAQESDVSDSPIVTP